MAVGGALVGTGEGAGGDVVHLLGELEGFNGLLLVLGLLMLKSERLLKQR